jgi:CRP-like cAMP-binding protein
VGAALWKNTLIDASVVREWAVNVGERQALARVAHLVCETMARMDAIGQCHHDTCSLRLTQSDLADMTGLSVVHVNRTLQELRSQELITFDGRTLIIHDVPSLHHQAMIGKAETAPSSKRSTTARAST